MKAFLAFLGIAVLGAAGAVHLRLTDSHPKADATLTESPAEIRVWFNQQPRLAVSRLGLSGAGGDIALDSVRGAEGRSFRAAVPDTLPPGEYTVSWRTAGDDGHILRGTYTFRMAATPAPRP